MNDEPWYRFRVVIEDHMTGGLLPASMVIAQGNSPKHLGPMLTEAAKIINETYKNKPDNWIPEVAERTHPDREHQCMCHQCRTERHFTPIGTGGNPDE